MPIRVAIDTSILRRDPRLRGGGFEALARLAEAGHVDIFIPEPVAKEFVSLPTDKATAVGGLRKALSDLRRAMPDEFAQTIESFDDGVSAQIQGIEAAAESVFKAWVARTGAEIVESCADHGQRVLEKYFEGRPPFKTRKSRGDFPDAFIVEILADLASDEPLLVATGDKRMAEALASRQNITVFEDLRSLLDADDFDDVKSEVEAKNVPRLLHLLLENKGRFDEAMTRGVTDLLGGRSLSYRDSSWDEKEGSEELYIQDAETVTKWSVDLSDADYLGEGVVSLAFDATVEVAVDQPTDSGYYEEGWYPGVAQPSMGATVNVDGACSFIFDQADLRNPIADLDLPGLLERTRLEVDELHGVYTRTTDRERW